MGNVGDGMENGGGGVHRSCPIGRDMLGNAKDLARSIKMPLLHQLNIFIVGR